MKVRSTAVALVGLVAIGVAMAVQLALPRGFTTNAETLGAANQVRGTLTVQPIGGAPYEVKFAFARKKYFRIETPKGLIVGEGENSFEYVSASNTYTKSASDPVSMSLRSELWAWAAFFQPDLAVLASGGRTGSKRKIRGIEVEEALVNLANTVADTATLYFDPKAGLIRGFTIKRGSDEWLIWSTDIATSSDEVNLAEFTFEAPPGAKEVAEMTPVPGWSGASKVFAATCMPCHGEARMGGLDLRTYTSTMASGSVAPKDPGNSKLFQYITGVRTPRMPKARAPLTHAQLKTVEAWIQAGASE